MTVQRLVFLLILGSGLTAIALANWAPVVALVILGGQTQALPLGLWLVGAIAIGAFTTLILTGLAQLLSGGGTDRPRRSSPRQPSSAYQSAYSPPPPPRDRTPASDWRRDQPQGGDSSPPSSASTSSKWRSESDDWSTRGRSPQDWSDWSNGAARPDVDTRSNYQPSDRQTVIQDAEDLPWANWQSYEAAEPEIVEPDVIDVDVTDSAPRDRQSSFGSNWHGYDDSDDLDVDDSNGSADPNDDFYYERINTTDLDDEEYDDDDDLEAIVSDWDNWDDDSGHDDDASDDQEVEDEEFGYKEFDETNDATQESAGAREITEINRRPTSTTQAGSIYSYSYRAPDAVKDSDTEDGDDDDVRVIIPPYRTESTADISACNHDDRANENPGYHADSDQP